jgi:hypothetical protein
MSKANPTVFLPRPVEMNTLSFEPSFMKSSRVLTRWTSFGIFTNLPLDGSEDEATHSANDTTLVGGGNVVMLLSGIDLRRNLPFAACSLKLRSPINTLVTLSFARKLKIPHSLFWKERGAPHNFPASAK